MHKYIVNIDLKKGSQSEIPAIHAFILACAPLLTPLQQRSVAGVVRCCGK